MIYPTINSYLDALLRGRRSFRTLKGLKLKYRDRDEPIFRASSSCVRVLMTCGKNKECVLRLFLHSDANREEKFKEMEGVEYFKEELLVDVNGTLSYFDIVVESKVSYYADGTNPQYDDEISEKSREDRVPFERDGLWGFKNDLGEIVIEAKYTTVSGFYESRATVCINDLWGLITKDGEEVIEVKYDELSYNNSHYAYVNYYGAMGVIDRSGHQVVECEWDWMAECSEGLFLVKRDELFGYVNTKGEVVIEPKYKDAHSFDRNGYAKVSLNGEDYYIITPQDKRA